MKQQLHTPVLLSILCFLFSIFSQAQEYEWQWAYRGGGTQNSIDGGTWDTHLEQIFDVKIDQYNNYYFADTILNFNPSFKGEDITKYGPDASDNDIYIVSLDCEGNFRWHTTIGGQARETTVSMALDTLGGLYISFSTPNTARPNNNNVPPHYAPGVALGPVFSNIPHSDARYIALIKYDTDGNYLWHHMPQDENVTAIPTDGYNHGGGVAYSIIAEPDGTLHWLCGFFPGNHINGELIIEDDDMPDLINGGGVYVILKYDKDGNYLSHIITPLNRGGGGNHTIKMHYDSLLQRYYIYTNRDTNSSSEGGDPVWNNTPLNVLGAVFALDSQGNELWTALPSPYRPTYTGASVHAVTTDSESNVYITGICGNTGQTQENYSSLAGYTFTQRTSSPYLIKLDSNGNLIWGTNLNYAPSIPVEQNNTCDRCPGRDIAVNGDEVALAVGLRSNHWGDLSMPTQYGHRQDPVLVRFNATTGEPIALHHIEGPGGLEDELMAVAVDHNGNYIVGGYGRSTLFLNNDNIGPLYSMGGDSDFFVAKLAKNNDCSIDECYGIVVPTPTGANVQTVASGTTLANLQVAGENLQWYADAELTEPLSENHIVENNTTYYVTQTLGGCTSAALAVTVSTLGVADFQKMKIKLYPNPTNGLLYIETSQEIQSYEVYNLIGQRLLSGSFTGSIDMKDISKGTYIIKLTIPTGEVFTEKVIKE